MNETHLEPDEALPLELKLRILQSELDRLEADFEWLRARRREILRQIKEFESRLAETRRGRTLRRVK